MSTKKELARANLLWPKVGNKGETNMSSEEMLILLHRLWEVARRDIDSLDRDIRQIRSEMNRVTERFNALEAEFHSRTPMRADTGLRYAK
jgi:hypothetical protein